MDAPSSVSQARRAAAAAAQDSFQAGGGAGTVLVSAADAWATKAERAAEATKDLMPRMGRACPHAEKSLGTPNAGAVSLSLIVRRVHTTLIGLLEVSR